MGPDDLLRILVSVLQEIGVPYLVTGSSASMACGEPRLTNDIDVVADLQARHIARLGARYEAK